MSPTIFLEFVWKVARYTSAAPAMFQELDNYVDGGVLANNPSSYGLTAIQTFHRYVHVMSRSQLSSSQISNCLMHVGWAIWIQILNDHTQSKIEGGF
jgi:patatin-like phospholipase/acyl hydrolase